LSVPRPASSRPRCLDRHRPGRTGRPPHAVRPRWPASDKNARWNIPTGAPGLPIRDARSVHARTPSSASPADRWCAGSIPINCWTPRRES
jgi:hypothetical protein